MNTGIYSPPPGPLPPSPAHFFHPLFSGHGLYLVMWQQFLLTLLVGMATNPEGCDQRLLPLVTAYGLSMDQEAQRAKKRKQAFEDLQGHDDFCDVGPPPHKRRNKKKKKKSYVYPTQGNRPRSVHDVFRKLGEVHFRCYFRLGKDEIIPFMRHLGIQAGEMVSCPTTRITEDAGVAFLMLLFRLTAPRPLRPDAELFFGQDKRRISRWAHGGRRTEGTGGGVGGGNERRKGSMSSSQLYSSPTEGGSRVPLAIVCWKIHQRNRGQDLQPTSLHP